MPQLLAIAELSASAACPMRESTLFLGAEESADTTTMRIYTVGEQE
jgi:hypothetical protein